MAASKNLTPEQRSLRARMAAHAMHAKNDSKATTAAAQAAFLSRFEREVDPDGVLPPEERARRADHAKRAYMSGLALKRAKLKRRAS